MKLYADMDALLAEMENFVREHDGYESPAWRSGDFAAGALLEFKDHHGDSRRDHWTVGDLSEFLLDWFPRTVLTEEDLQRDVPECAAAFFRFMAARGSLTGDPLPALETACVSLRGQFLTNCSDPRIWDPGKVRLSRIITPSPAESLDVSAARQAPVREWRRSSRVASGAARENVSTPAAKRMMPGLR